MYEHAEEIIKPWKYDKYLNADIAEIALTATCYMLHVTLLKPQTFMNLSGKTIKKFATCYTCLRQAGAARLFIAHDDLDLRLGNFKIQMGTGPKMHNGISSIEDTLGTKDFWRIRIGIDNRDEDNAGSGESYVLGRFTEVEQKQLQTDFNVIYQRFLFNFSQNPIK